eukprot:3486355-Ditylum_brightwellii.AAC.1
MFAYTDPLPHSDLMCIDSQDVVFQADPFHNIPSHVDVTYMLPQNQDDALGGGNDDEFDLDDVLLLVAIPIVIIHLSMA